MIVVDIETSGLDFNKCGIWQIGALELENPANTFLEEARIDDEDEILNDPQAKKRFWKSVEKQKKNFGINQNKAKKNFWNIFLNGVEILK